MGTFLIGIAWIPVSLFFDLALAAAEDRPDMRPVPRLLKAAYVIVSFPMEYSALWESDDIPAGLSQNRYMLLIHFGEFINGLFWGFVLFCLIRFAAKFIVRKDANKPSD